MTKMLDWNLIIYLLWEEIMEVVVELVQLLILVQNGNARKNQLGNSGIGKGFLMYPF